jgi:hypothetical protein
VLDGGNGVDDDLRLMFSHFIAPEQLTEDVIVAAFQALAGPAEQSPGSRGRQAP